MTNRTPDLMKREKKRQSNASRQMKTKSFEKAPEVSDLGGKCF
jgi:hypothetical protein